MYAHSFQCRNVLVSVSGLENIQLVHSCECQTTTLTEDDWDETDLSPPNLPPITRRQKLFWVEYSRLATIGKPVRLISSRLSIILTVSSCLLGAQCLSLFKGPRMLLSSPEGNTIITSFESWRTSLPSDLRLDPPQVVTHDDVWPAVLMAISYRFECAIYRRACRQYQGNADPSDSEWAKTRLRRAVFEMDMLIGRVMSYRMLSMLPLSLYAWLS